MTPAEQVRQDLETKIAQILPSSSLLPFKYDLATNAFLKGKNYYAATIQDGTELNLVAKRLDIEQSYQVALTTDYVASSENDDDISRAIDFLTGKINEIYTELVYTKFSTPVVLVSQLSIDAPEIIDDNSIVALSFTLVIQLRNRLQESKNGY